mmetsp:Transcript_20887/g.23232  ORF Transcript_20887/g.23232 Transcript_20887/m.23232 type:complete len:204 (+) Transcript_20887:134-745(+)
MKFGNLLIQNFWQYINLSLLVGTVFFVSPQVNSSHNLVSERVRHNERWVTSGTSEIQKSSFSKDDNGVTVFKLEFITLWFNVNSCDSWVGLKSFHINFVIEMSNVSNNSIVLHLRHMFSHDNSLVTGGSNEDISFSYNRFKSLYLKSFHTGLEGTDWVNFGNGNSGTSGLHGSGRSFTNITISTDNNMLSGDHDISSSHDTIW